MVYGVIVIWGYGGMVIWDSGHMCKVAMSGCVGVKV